jgi:geranylgeranyl transferase type-2 subunit beta
MIRFLSATMLALTLAAAGQAQQPAASDAPDAKAVLDGLRQFYAKTARDDGSFQPGIDPDYQGMSDSAFSDLAAITYACTIHKTFGWKLPHPNQTAQLLLRRQSRTGHFVNLAGTVDPASPQGKTYNTTQALVALKALGIKPRFDPLPVFEDILKQDYKTLPAYSTSFFPLAYLCAGRPIPEQADRSIRALMVQDDDGYLNNHIAATFHASHYYALVGDPTPKSAQIVERTLREQNLDGSWLLNLPSRDRHATFDAVFTLLHEGQGRPDCRAAIEHAARWALSCRNEDGGFGHFPGSTSDADAVYFQVGTLVMAGFLKPVDPLPDDPQLLSWGHLMPLRQQGANDPKRILTSSWVGGLAISRDGLRLVTGSASGVVQIWDTTRATPVGVFKGHTNAVTAVALSADERILATGSYDQSVRIWDVSTSNERHRLTGHRGAVLSVAHSPDGSTLATGGIDRDIRLWDAASGKQQRTLTGHKSWVNSLAFSPDGKWLASASSDGTVKIWSLAGEQLHTLLDCKAEVRSVAVSPDGKHLAAGIRYGAVKVWQTADWQLVESWEHPSDDAWAVAFHADSQRLVIAAGEWNRPTKLVVRSIASGEQVSELKHPGEVLCVAVSADGKTIAAGGGDQTVSVWRGGP